MKRKAAISLIWSVILGIIIIIIILIPAFVFSGNLTRILTGENYNEIDSEKLFVNGLLVKIKNLPVGEKQSFLYSTGEGYMVVGFNKNKDRIGEAGQKCGYVNKEGRIINELKSLSFDQPIYKPRVESCNNRDCLCLCKTSVSGEELCNLQGSYICESFDYDVKDDTNTCGYFFMNDGKETRNIYLRKDSTGLYITKVRT